MRENVFNELRLFDARDHLKPPTTARGGAIMPESRSDRSARSSSVFDILIVGVLLSVDVGG